MLKFAHSHRGISSKPDDYDQRDDPGWFRDELRGRDRLIAELRSELDEANDLLRKFSDAGMVVIGGRRQSWINLVTTMVLQG